MLGDMREEKKLSHSTPLSPTQPKNWLALGCFIFDFFFEILGGRSDDMFL
jgi:hypothetical protein